MISSFLDYLSFEKNYSKHTVNAYRTDLLSFQEFCLSTFESDDISLVNYSQIRSWIVFLSNAGFSNRTINRKISALNSFFKFSVKLGLLQINPLVQHKALKVQKKKQVPFSQQELQSVLELLNTYDDFESLRNKLMVELLYSTGIRRAELIGLKVSDVDMHQKQLKVLGKRSKERYVPLLESVIVSLGNYLELRASYAGTGQEFLLLTTKGAKIYDTLVYRVVNSYFSEVSMKVKRSPHILRHSFATHLLNQGADLNSVKELLGHSSLTSTQVYTHNSMEQIKKIFNQAHPRSLKK